VIIFRTVEIEIVGYAPTRNVFYIIDQIPEDIATQKKVIVAK